MTPVSIIIPAWNEAKTIVSTMQALAGIAQKKLCEVIVVAGGEDGTYGVAVELNDTMKAFERYLVIAQQSEGKNAAIQKGIAKSTKEIIVLLDGDTTVSKRWFKEMLAPIVAGECEMTIANPVPVVKNWISDYYMIIKMYHLDSISTYSGNCMAFQGSIVRGRLDYFFDKEVRVGVDYLLAKRFLNEGRVVRFAEKAVVKTHMPSTLKYFTLCELRWLIGLLNIDGVNYRALACHLAVVSAVIFMVPMFKPLFVLAVLLNTVFIAKQGRMFVTGSRGCQTPMRRIFGFVALCYLYHALGVISYGAYLLGVSKHNYLRQGQRY